MQPGLLVRLGFVFELRQAAAQVPGSSTRALGMGNAYSALARGYEAIAWNPAMLASTHGYGVTIGLPQASGELGNNAYSIDDILRDAMEPVLKRAQAAGIKVIDLLENPQLAKGDQILAIPTLVRRLPQPVRKIIGDLSDSNRVLVGLDLRPADGGAADEP